MARTWAVLIAMCFRRDNAEQIEDGAHWWEVPVQWQVINGGGAEAE